jgi:hypothetical protein
MAIEGNFSQISSNIAEVLGLFERTAIVNI